MEINFSKDQVIIWDNNSYPYNVNLYCCPICGERNYKNINSSKKNYGHKYNCGLTLESAVDTRPKSNRKGVKYRITGECREYIKAIESLTVYEVR